VTKYISEISASSWFYYKEICMRHHYTGKRLCKEICTKKTCTFSKHSLLMYIYFTRKHTHTHTYIYI